LTARRLATEEAEQVMHSALRKGLSVKTAMGNTIVLAPPLNIEEEHLDRCFAEITN